jgi:hypothetical protein
MSGVGVGAKFASFFTLRRRVTIAYAALVFLVVSAAYPIWTGQIPIGMVRPMSVGLGLALLSGSALTILLLEEPRPQS